jgi:hypothetical protein
MAGKRGAKFLLSKLNFLLDNIKNVMPIAGTEWDTMASIHNEEYPQHARTAESLHWKFQEVVQKTHPTGDPNCPPHVRRANLINRQLVQMIDGLIGGSDRSNSGEGESELEEGISLQRRQHSSADRDLQNAFFNLESLQGWPRFPFKCTLRSKNHCQSCIICQL